MFDYLNICKLVHSLFSFILQHSVGNGGKRKIKFKFGNAVTFMYAAPVDVKY